MAKKEYKVSFEYWHHTVAESADEAMESMIQDLVAMVKRGNPNELEEFKTFCMKAIEDEGERSSSRGVSFSLVAPGELAFP